MSPVPDWLRNNCCCSNYAINTHSTVHQTPPPIQNAPVDLIICIPVVKVNVAIRNIRVQLSHNPRYKIITVFMTPLYGS